VPPRGKRLVRECQNVDPSFVDLDAHARGLDQFYIPTRYPTGLDEETPPARYYDQTDSERCLQSAHSILQRVNPFFAS